MGFKNLSVAFCFAGLATSASAATISISSFDMTSYNTALAASGPVITENFETFSEGNVGDLFQTSVGTFATTGGTGTGGTVTQSGFANDGSQLAIRDGNVYGRTSTTAALTGDSADDKFLDSNDTFGIEWVAGIGGQAFNRLLLTLTDAADVGATMTVTSGGDTLSFSTAGNGNQQLVVIDFASAVSSASVFFESSDKNGARKNDGFSLDDIAIAPVPLPASGLILATALMGMGAYARKKKS